MAGILALPLTLCAAPLDEQQADDIESEDELAHQKRMVCAVIQRLITKEHWIIGLNDDEVCARNVCVRVCVFACTCTRTFVCAREVFLLLLLLLLLFLLLLFLPFRLLLLWR